MQLKGRNNKFQGRDTNSDWKRHKTGDGRRSRGQEIQRTSEENREKGEKNLSSVLFPRLNFQYMNGLE